MARKGKRKKRKGAPHHTPQSLRELWEWMEEVRNLPGVKNFELGVFKRHGIESYQDLLAAHRRDPRKISRELEEERQRIRRLLREGITEDERAIEAKEAEAASLQEDADVLRHLAQYFNTANLTDEQKERIKSLPPDALRVIDALCRLQVRREKRGAAADDTRISASEIGTMTGFESEEVERLLHLAEDTGLVAHQAGRIRASVGTRPRDQRHIGLTLPDHDDLSSRGGGLVMITTATLKHFTRLAHEEGLPRALPDRDLNALATLGRHIITDHEVRILDGGRHYVRVEMLAASKGIMADHPDTGKYAGAPLAEAIEDLLEDDLPPALRDIRTVWAESGWIEETEEGWRWKLTAEQIQGTLQAWEARELGQAVEIECDLPLRQFGLLLEAGKARIPKDDGADMPIHGGSRSFEAIWRRQTRLADFTRKAEERLHAMAERDDAEELGPNLMREAVHWGGRGVAASGVLNHLRECRTVAVDLDVSEGLPDWDSAEEAWDYAREAQLPFPITYFDFTTPGGYRPKIALPTAEGEQVITLRAAICWTMEDHLAIAPFAWMEEAQGDPDRLDHRNDYDAVGAMHFGRRIPLLRRDGQEVEEHREPITHLRITSDDGVSAPAQLVLTEPIYGQPGWVDLHSDLEATEARGDDLLLAEASVVVAAACRVLSVIHALDSTVNIELAEADTTRPERREVERAQQKGKQAEISRTVRIHPTRQNDRDPADHPTKREYSHAHWRRGHFAHYPMGTRMADRLAERDHTKLVDHPVKGLCRKVYRKPTIVGRTGPDGEEREPVAKSYVWAKEPRRR